MTTRHSPRSRSRLLGRAAGLTVGLASAWGGVPANAAAPSPIEVARSMARLDNYLESLAEAPLESWMLRRVLDEAPSVGGLNVVIERVKERASGGKGARGALLVLGQLLSASGDQEGALRAFGEAETRGGGYETAFLTGLVHKSARRDDAAFEAFDRALAAVPRGADLRTRQTMLEAALELALDGRVLERVKTYAAALSATDPRDTSLAMREASALESMGATDDAIALWRALEKKAGSDLDALIVAWKELARTLEVAGRGAEAEAVWRRALGKVPRGNRERLTLWYGLVSAARSAGTLDAVISELDGEVGREPELAVVLAGVLEELGRTDDAIKVWRQAVVKLPRREDVRLGLLRTLERVGKPADVLEVIEGLVKLAPGEPMHRLRLADLLMATDGDAKVPAVLRDIVKRFGDDPGLLQQVLARWIRRNNKADRKDVELVFRKLLQAEPDEPDHVVSYGSWLWSVDEKASARTTWRRLETMTPAAGRGFFDEAVVLFEHDERDDALTVLEQALRKAPTEPTYLALRAKIAEAQRKTTDALAAWHEVRRVAPAGSAAADEADKHTLDLWDGQRALAQRIEALKQETQRRITAGDKSAQVASDGRLVLAGLLRLGSLDDAQAWLALLGATETSAKALAQVGEDVAVRKGDLAEAAAHAERLAVEQPALAHVHLARAANYAVQAGDVGAASRLAAEIVKANPGEAAAHSAAGDVLLRLERTGEAIAAFERAAALDPTDIEARFRLATFYRADPTGVREGPLLLGILRDARERRDVERAGLRLLAGGPARWGPVVSGEFLATVRKRAEAAGDDGPHLRLYIDVALKATRDDKAHRAMASGSQEPSVRVLTTAMRSSDQGLRAAALELVALTRPEGTLGALSLMARDADPVASARAIELIGTIGSPGAVAILDGLYAGKDARVRDLALWAAGLAGGDTAFPLLERAARGNQRADKLRAALGLAVNPPRRAAELITRLLVESASDVREAAAGAARRWLELHATTATSETDTVVAAVATALAHSAGHPLEYQATLVSALCRPLPPRPTERAREAMIDRLWQDPAVDGLLDIGLRGLASPVPSVPERADALLAAYGGLVDRSRGRAESPTPMRPILAVLPDVQAPTLDRIAPAPDATAISKRFGEVIGAPSAGYEARLQTNVLRALAAPVLTHAASLRAAIEQGALSGAETQLAAIARLHPDAPTRIDALALLSRVPGGEGLALKALEALIPTAPDHVLTALARAEFRTVTPALGAFVTAVAPDAIAPEDRAGVAEALMRHGQPTAAQVEAWLAVRDPAAAKAVLSGLEARVLAGDSRAREIVNELRPRLVELALGPDAMSALVAGRLLGTRDAVTLARSPWPAVRALVAD